MGYFTLHTAVTGHTDCAYHFYHSCYPNSFTNADAVMVTISATIQKQRQVVENDCSACYHHYSGCRSYWNQASLQKSCPCSSLVSSTNCWSDLSQANLVLNCCLQLH